MGSREPGVSGPAPLGYRRRHMTLPAVPERPPAAATADHSPLRAVACDASIFAGRPDGPTGCVALARARARGLRVGLVYDRWPPGPDVCAAEARGDVIAVPEADEVTAGQRREVRPEFVTRLCSQLGVAPGACIVIGARRGLLAAAAWVGTRTVMVPDDATPLFDVRCQPLAPNLAAALDGALVERGPG